MRVKLKQGEKKSGNENNASLFGMTYITWREGQLAARLKRLC